MQQPSNPPQEAQVIDALKTVFDPEIPVNVYDLGLIYNISIDREEGAVDVTMTLTNPNCPVADEMPDKVEEAVEQVEGVKKVRIDLVFDPPWSTDNISEAAKLELGLL